MTNRCFKITQSGRSMVEMLGVLAVIGVLTAGVGVWINAAWNNYKANTVTDTVQRNFEIISEWLPRGSNNPNYGSDIEKEQRQISWATSTYQATGGTGDCAGGRAAQTTGFPKSVCHLVKEQGNWKAIEELGGCVTLNGVSVSEATCQDEANTITVAVPTASGAHKDSLERHLCSFGGHWYSDGATVGDCGVCDQGTVKRGAQVVPQCYQCNTATWQFSFANGTSCGTDMSCQDGSCQCNTGYVLETDTTDTCVECNTNSDCADRTDGKIWCDISNNTCKTCEEAGRIWNTDLEDCTECSATDRSKCSAATPICDVSAGVCIACSGRVGEDGQCYEDYKQCRRICSKCKKAKKECTIYKGTQTWTIPANVDLTVSMQKSHTHGSSNCKTGGSSDEMAATLTFQGENHSYIGAYGTFTAKTLQEEQLSVSFSDYTKHDDGAVYTCVSYTKKVCLGGSHLNPSTNDCVACLEDSHCAGNTDGKTKCDTTNNVCTCSTITEKTPFWYGTTAGSTSSYVHTIGPYACAYDVYVLPDCDNGTCHADDGFCVQGSSGCIEGFNLISHAIGSETLIYRLPAGQTLDIYEINTRTGTSPNAYLYLKFRLEPTTSTGETCFMQPVVGCSSTSDFTTPI